MASWLHQNTCAISPGGLNHDNNTQGSKLDKSREHTYAHGHPQSLTCLAHSPSGLVSMVTTAGMVSLAAMEGWGGGDRAREGEVSR